ncbi:MAG: hypothetical protein LQ349_009450, partial [Xanthoria aureola]
EYGITPDEVDHIQSDYQFTVGADGVVAVVLSAYFGRLPALFWFMVMAAATAAEQTLNKHIQSGLIIIATILAEAIGPCLHQILTRLYVRSHGGRIEPEARLSVIYIALPFLLASLIVLWFALERKWYYMVTVEGGTCTCSVSIGISAYLLDSYPHESGEVGAYIKLLEDARREGGGIAGIWEEAKDVGEDVSEYVMSYALYAEAHVQCE